MNATMWKASLFLLLCSSASYAQNQMICPKDVRRFSADSIGQYYYECTGEGATPIRKRCRDGQRYWPSKELCQTRPEGHKGIVMGSEYNDLQQYETPVFGRTAMLGSVYDATRNMIYPADSLWTRDTILKNKVVSSSYSSDVDFFAAQTTFDRLLKMDVDAHLKLEFMGGLIKVEGSAAFARDSVESLNTLAFVMKAHYITRTETLPVSIPKEFTDVCDLKHVTHVITSLTYGMDAYFAFKKTVKKNESRKKISGTLNIAVRSIPSIKILGDGKLVMDASLKEMIRGIKVKLRGDFVLDIQPTTYNESVFVFKTLTSHLGEKPDYNQSSKMKMTLTPVTRFCDKSAAILREISKALVNSVTHMLNKVEMTEMKIKTIRLSDSVVNYMPLQKVMNLLATSLSVLDLQLKSELGTILPKIRGGARNSSEKDLVTLLTKYKLSPVNAERANVFLKTRKREIVLLDDILKPERFEGTGIVVVRYEDADDERILFEKEIVLMLRFNVLSNVSVVERFLNGNDVDERESWFNDVNVVSQMGRVFKLFLNFANANRASNNKGFLLLVGNAKEESIEVVAQKNGKILTNDFVIPGPPLMITVISNKYNSVTFRVDRPTNKWVDGFTLKHWKFARKSVAGESQFTFKDSNLYEIVGLSANEAYIFSAKYDTAMGDSPYGQESSPVLTKPTSAPENLRTREITSKSVTLHWDCPMHIGKGVQISNYDVTITHGGKVIKKNMTGGTRSILIQGLEPATTYNISVQTVAKLQKGNDSKSLDEVASKSSKAWLELVTSPDTPSQPTLVAVGRHTAHVVWNPPTKLAVGATLQEYLVQYVTLNNRGDEAISGSVMVQSSKTNTSINLKDLVQGTTYGISVKAVTSLGTSDYSPVIIVKTRFKQTELDKLRSSVDEEIKHSVSISTVNLENRIRSEAEDLNNKIRNETKDLNNKIRSEAKDLNNKIHSKVNYLDNKIGDVQNTLDERIDDLWTVHPKWKCGGHAAVFIGRGYADYDGSELTFLPSLDDCCDWCGAIRSTRGKKWNGFYFLKRSNMCRCYKNASFIIADTDYVYYKYV